MTDEPLGVCDYHEGAMPHSQHIWCENWRPVEASAPADSIDRRLAKGERGIPKIPDSPDTRHARASAPAAPPRIFEEWFNKRKDFDFWRGSGPDKFHESEMAACWKAATEAAVPDAELRELRARRAGLVDAAELALRERDIPESEGGNLVRYDACDNVGIRIRTRIQEIDRAIAAREKELEGWK